VLLKLASVCRVVERLPIYIYEVPATLNGTRQLHGSSNTYDSITPHSTVISPLTHTSKEIL
jgi:hypothetical protein